MSKHDVISRAYLDEVGLAGNLQRTVCRSELLRIQNALCGFLSAEEDKWKGTRKHLCFLTTADSSTEAAVSVHLNLTAKRKSKYKGHHYRDEMIEKETSLLPSPLFSYVLL